MLVYWSAIRTPGHVNYLPYISIPTLTLDMQTQAYNWLSSNPKFLFVPTPTKTQTMCYFSANGKPQVTMSKVKKFVHAKKLALWKTFDDFVNSEFNMWQLKLHEDNWRSSCCTCPSFLKHYICKHIIGMAVHKNPYEFPDTVKCIPLGQQRKPGRPKGTTKALIRQ